MRGMLGELARVTGVAVSPKPCEWAHCADKKLSYAKIGVRPENVLCHSNIHSARLFVLPLPCKGMHEVSHALILKLGLINR
jgi:hypothetical protein